MAELPTCGLQMGCLESLERLQQVRWPEDQTSEGCEDGCKLDQWTSLNSFLDLSLKGVYFYIHIYI